MSRRQLLGSLAASVVPACLHQVHFSAQPVRDGCVRIPPEPLTQLKGPADVLFVRADGVPAALALRRQGSGYLALLAQCTHRGCELSALPQSYDCPCHGSRFDLSGEVLDGPAERALSRYPVVPDGAGLAIVLPGGRP